MAVKIANEMAGQMLFVENDQLCMPGIGAVSGDVDGGGGGGDGGCTNNSLLPCQRSMNR